MDLKKGGVYKSNAYGDVEVIKRITGSTTLVKFKDSGGLAAFRNSDIRAGKVKDYTVPTLYKKGIVSNIKLARDSPEAFGVWSQMIKRAYDEVWHKTNPTYVKVEVSADWLFFPRFKRWYDKQLVGEGFILDKDIYTKTKVYSARTAFMIPYSLNMFYSVNTTDKNDGLPMGVHRVRSKFVVRINRFNNYFPSDKSKSGSYVGTYDGKRVALSVYSYYRARMVLMLIAKYKGKFSKTIYTRIKNKSDRLVRLGILDEYRVKQDPLNHLK